jgi:hypothetical protein
MRPVSRKRISTAALFFASRPPPALTSHAYSAAFNEVMSLGIANSTSATPDQALTGRFWKRRGARRDSPRLFVHGELLKLQRRRVQHRN